MPIDLIVQPIDLSKPGSFRERREYLKLARRLRDLRKESDDASIDVYDQIEALVIPRLRTADGSPVQDALDKLSANQFDQLLSAIAFEGGLGEAKAAPSQTGRGDADATTQTG